MSTPINQNAKITVHWLEKSRAHRIVWLLEELNVPYELKIYKRDENNRAPRELREVHPLGKSPIISVLPAGAEKELVIAESSAIIEYLVDHFGSHLIPKRYQEGREGVVGGETEEWLRYRYLMHYPEGSLMPILVFSVVINAIRNSPVPFFLKPIVRGVANKVDTLFINPEMKRNLVFLEDYLSKSAGEFFAGSQLTAADFSIVFPIEGVMSKKVVTAEKYPKLYEYVLRMQARDAYKRAGDKVTEVSGEKYVNFSEGGM
ncbi:glutathione S-transferas-like protein [Delitschia confertaspora ATCC 74209]|uniref:glutathione transferase n=1 Tax=Delitschia confertaspora ATCC 74209 TaxID=1513339 RepID=A0A9P4JI13_9PLEO|nr:glutathione S-transferas-like protein [Delitschia confertaspora ATCC 74209]